jgi:NRAMP (natural resistance-associated macrophage protein)-like metal ion transporter
VIRRRRPRRHSAFAQVTLAGPELLSAASDNDPTNVGTAAVVGAQTGYQLAWVAVLVAPLLAVVQTLALRVAVAAGSDLQSLTSKRYGRKVALTLLVSVVVVNVVTIAADLQAGAAGLGLLAGVDGRWLVLPLGLGVLALLLVGKYDEVVSVLRYLLIGFLAFAAAAITAGPDWARLLRDSFVPSLSLHRPVLAGALAMVGTTLTAYVYVWETIERGVEEPLDTANGKRLFRARVGTIAGAVFTAVIFWFMLVASAATLGRTHHSVSSAQDAARALRPLAGSLASDLFAIGLVVSALVALPVLMATTAYVVGAQFNWRRGLSEGIGRARGFYGVMAASIGLAVAVAAAGVSLLSMLVAASIIGGIGTPLGLVVLVVLSRDRAVMGEHPVSPGLAAAGWAVAILVGSLGLLFLVGPPFGLF